MEDQGTYETMQMTVLEVQTVVEPPAPPQVRPAFENLRSRRCNLSLTSLATALFPLARPQSNDGSGSSFTLALLVLLGVIALSGLVYTVYHLTRVFKRPRELAATDPSQRPPRRSASAASDLERGLSAEAEAGLVVVGRSDSMVARASAWARAVLAGQPTPRTSSGKKEKPVSLPVKQAIFVVQPDG